MISWIYLIGATLVKAVDWVRELLL